MIKKILEYFLYPYLIRSDVVGLIKKWELGSYEKRLKIGAVQRPHYGYCVYQAAALAKSLGYERISVLEFGVAGGNGLINLEYHASEVSKIFSIDIEIYGFDTGEGLPEPLDYRDLPYHWEAGFFKMDVPKLQAKLKTAKLVLGNVKDTVKSFLSEYNPAPIAAVMCDLDFYSSTLDSLKIFEADEKFYLPRVYCYFDDTIGGPIESYNDYIGQRLAINEFNQSHQTKKLGIPYYLLTQNILEKWYHQIFIYHDFEHSKYNEFVSKDNQQLPLIG